MKNASAICRANQIQCCFGGFLRVKETKQHHSKEEWNQYIVLTHLSPRGTQEDTSCRQWWCVWLWVCNGVINYMPLVTCVCSVVCIFSATYMKITSIWLSIGKHAGWYVIYVLWVYSSMCEFRGSVRCYWAWSVCGWQVFAGRSAPVRFPRKPQVLVAPKPGLHRAWLKDASLISLVRESVNSLWMTSSGPAN